MMKDWFGPHDPGDPMNGSLKYSDVVLDHYRNPRNVGEVPGTAAVALVSMLERFCYFWLVRGGPFKRDVVIDTIAAIWYEALFGQRKQA